MRIAVARSALLPLLAALPGLAAPGTLKPAAVASRDDGDIKLFIDVGTDTTVIINGVSKSSTSVDDTELFDLGPGPFNALGMLVESRLDPGDPGSMYNYTCYLTGTATAGAMFETGNGSCFIRASADGSMTSYGVTVDCGDLVPFGAPCQRKSLPEPSPSGYIPL